MAIAYVYVLSVRSEDWLKVGSSGDPLRRAREFSSRFFDLFDLEQSLLVEVEGRKRDALQLELALRRRFPAHRAPMPGSVRAEAGGHTEWLRGAYPALLEAARHLQAEGYAVHQPAHGWFRGAMELQRDQLHEWARALLREHQLDPDVPWDEPLPLALAQPLRDAVDAFHHFGWDTQQTLPAALRGWYDESQSRILGRCAGLGSG